MICRNLLIVRIVLNQFNPKVQMLIIRRRCDQITGSKWQIASGNVTCCQVSLRKPGPSLRKAEGFARTRRIADLAKKFAIGSGSRFKNTSLPYNLCMENFSRPQALTLRTAKLEPLEKFLFFLLKLTNGSCITRASPTVAVLKDQSDRQTRPEQIS